MLLHTIESIHSKQESLLQYAAPELKAHGMKVYNLPYLLHVDSASKLTYQKLGRVTERSCTVTVLLKHEHEALVYANRAGQMYKEEYMSIEHSCIVAAEWVYSLRVTAAAIEPAWKLY